MRSTLLFASVFLGLSPLVFADAPPITLTVTNGRLVTNAANAVPAHIFLSDIGENGFVNTTDDPQFISTELSPGEQIGLRLLGPLRVWLTVDHTWAYPEGSDELIQISVADQWRATVNGVSTPRDVGVFATADGSGQLDGRLAFHIRIPCGCLVSFGIYAVRMQVTSSVHAPSDPFLVLFTYYMDDGTIGDATAGAPWLLDHPPCGGDLTLDNQVGLSDLTVLLSNFGLTGALPLEGDIDGDFDVDLSDLTAFLSNFGSICSP